MCWEGRRGEACDRVAIVGIDDDAMDVESDTRLAVGLNRLYWINGAIKVRIRNLNWTLEGRL